jgi:hypothetical protein
VSDTITKTESASTSGVLAAAVDRLDHRVNLSRRRLRARLSSLYEAHGLKSSELWESQRKISRMATEDEFPTPSEFWAETAEPWASVLTTTCIAAIEEEVGALSDAVGRFAESIAIANSNGANISNQKIRSVLAEHLTGPIMSASPNSDPLDALGVGWHSKLRRAAWRKTFPAALFRSATASDLKIASAQVELASQEPWAHGDRLLSAFEGAQADIREHLVDALANATTVQPTGISLPV